MSELKHVKLNLDRNGIVTAIDPEATMLRSGGSVIYELQEPGRDTNWEFLGVQLGESRKWFKKVEIFGGTQLMLTLSDEPHSGDIETTLLYTLDKSEYFCSGDPSTDDPENLKKKLSVKAFDPLIIAEN